MLEPTVPGTQLLGMIALRPHLDGRDHAHDLFAPDLEAAAEAMMRSAANPRRLRQILAADQETGALRSAQALAAAVGDQIRPLLKVWIGYRQAVGRSVDENRNAVRFRQLAISVNESGPRSDDASG